MHLPSCMTCCTVGGALAHNGIGILSTKYGKMDDMCLSLEVVLPNGDIINTLPVPKHSSGPNLIPFFVGSEGTLGIMTKAKFKIVKQPETRIHHAFLFSDIHVGYQACRDIVQAVKPSIVRLFDEAETVSIIKKIIGFEKRGSFLNLTLEGYEKVVAAELEIVLDIAKKYGADFTLRKDKTTQPPHYIVIFKAKDADNLEQAFREFTAKTLSKEQRPSIRKVLTAAKQKAAQQPKRAKEKIKQRGLER